MKTIIKSSLACCTLLIMSANCYSQNNLENRLIFNSFPEIEYVDNSGLHLEFDAGYAPFGIWSVSETSTKTTEVLVTDKITSETTKTVGTITEEKELKASYAVGANLALVYQWRGDIYLGGGTGVRMQELSWKGDGKPYSRNWGIPFYLRFGATQGFQGIKKTSFYLNGDLGILIGTGDLKTSLLTDIQAGIYYGTTKIGLGFMTTKPNYESYFDHEIDTGFNLAFGLFMGFRIF